MTGQPRNLSALPHCRSPQTTCGPEPCAPHSGCCISSQRPSGDSVLTLGSSQAPGGRGGGTGKETDRGDQGPAGRRRSAEDNRSLCGPERTSVGDEKRGAGGAGGLWATGEHGGFPTYPGHVGRVAGLIVRQVARMVAAAGHGADGRARWPPPLSSVAR